MLSNFFMSIVPTVLKKIIKGLVTSLLILLFVAVVTFFGSRSIYLFERGVYYGYNLILEYKISKALDKVRQSKNLQSIALQNFTDKKIRKACVQSPYTTQTLFEELVGEEVNEFTETSDHDGYLLWVFFLDGSTSRVRIFMSFAMRNRSNNKQIIK